MIPKFRDELSASVGCYSLRNSMQANYTGEVKFGKLLGGVVVLTGMKCATLVSLSVMTHMASFPCRDRGSPTIKSIPISSHFHSGILFGCNSPAGFWCSALMR